MKFLENVNKLVLGGDIPKKQGASLKIMPNEVIINLDMFDMLKKI